MNSIYTFTNRIITGDCIAVMKDMPRASVDLIVTDPPYLARYQSRDGRKLANATHGSEWLNPAFAEMARVLKPDRFCVSLLRLAESRPLFGPHGAPRDSDPSAIWSGRKTTIPTSALCATPTSRLSACHR